MDLINFHGQAANCSTVQLSDQNAANLRKIILNQMLITCKLTHEYRNTCIFILMLESFASLAKTRTDPFNHYMS